MNEPINDPTKREQKILNKTSLYARKIWTPDTSEIDNDTFDTQTAFDLYVPDQYRSWVGREII